ncbi:hypothetical protein K5E_05960 [Enterococcus thailandicus]|uniref:hypothetical protein n=1 Tax=Enterococcus TaxID=1350 RepID=UPI000AA7C6D3|nr:MULTISPECIES: hypothetical protein [Enterococcus]MDK4353305.1 hypothetical protein [Enterococcus thailandicus]MDT2733575.1 hypothetical protein [Enterococcus thailandicus]MDT2846100.1 hypothetical protein [Enterococcus thailandicus]GMC00218.1 hypothetical protein K2F_04770 [Enterococcus thailandicus]GMC04197.1 hypothetical protein K4E_17360 [Enterococcus thailandicus]
MNTVNEVAAPSNKDALFKIAFHKFEVDANYAEELFLNNLYSYIQKGVRQAFCRTPFFGKML